MPHQNNFDFLRLVFSLLVIVTHSYPLTGLPEQDALWHWSGGVVSFSSFGVLGFFSLSGYLIMQSLSRSRNLVDYFWKRSLRIFPALWFNLLLVVFVLGPVLSPMSLAEYLGDVSVRSYLLHNLVLHTQYEFGQLFVGNPLSGAVNGSLWTIPYEFFCYVLLAALFVFRRKRVLLATMLAVLLLIASSVRIGQPAVYKSFIPLVDLGVKHLSNLSIYFMVGALLAVLGAWFQERKQLFFWTALGATTLGSLLGYFALVQFYTLPVLVVAFGGMSVPYLRRVGRFGDFSYGIYLYGFVVQQSLVHYFSPSLWVLTAASAMLATLLAAVSWHLVEKRALQLKTLKFSFIK